ncbi:MAG: hypothetical protein HYV07_00475 [Deltaproteobacteria bacterium]|nr:hypothetical protein [Deltaproteobacteria bacterium]
MSEGPPNSTRLETYFENYTFTETSHVRKDGDTIWIPEAYCSEGHALMRDDVRIDGRRAIHLLARRAGSDGPLGDLFLSPALNDPRKLGVRLLEGEVTELHCPTCQASLRQLTPCTCRVGAYVRAIYLTPDPNELGAVGVCETWGCPRFFVTEGGELLYELLVD